MNPLRDVTSRCDSGKLLHVGEIAKRYINVRRQTPDYFFVKHSTDIILVGNDRYFLQSNAEKICHNTVTSLMVGGGVVQRGFAFHKCGQRPPPCCFPAEIMIRSAFISRGLMD